MSNMITHYLSTVLITLYDIKSIERMVDFP